MECNGHSFLGCFLANLGQKNDQSPLGFLLLLLDPQGIQFHGKKLPHITLEIFDLIFKFIFGQDVAPNISTCSHLLQRNVFFFFSPIGSSDMS